MNKPGIKQVEVQIMSQTYMLACPVDGEPALREAVAKVDSAMCRIRDAGKVKARDRIAVLAALNIAFELSQKDPASAFRNSSFGNTESGETAESAATLLGADETRLRALIDKLDNALAEDGRLI
jgi:cell division protein ZapA